MCNNKGLSTVESGILLSVIIAGIVGMSIYLQRGMQGGLFQSSQSIGLQFDPADPYEQTDTLSDTVSTSTQSGGAPFAQIPTIDGGRTTYLTGPFQTAPNWQLHQLSISGVPREPSSWMSTSEVSRSTVTTHGTYDVEH